MGNSGQGMSGLFESLRNRSADLAGSEGEVLDIVGLNDREVIGYLDGLLQKYAVNTGHNVVPQDVTANLRKQIDALNLPPLVTDDRFMPIASVTDHVQKAIWLMEQHARIDLPGSNYPGLVLPTHRNLFDFPFDNWVEKRPDSKILVSPPGSDLGDVLCRAARISGEKGWHVAVEHNDYYLVVSPEMAQAMRGRSKDELFEFCSSFESPEA